MMSPNKILTLLTCVITLTISDFPLIQNPKSQILYSQVLAQTPDDRKSEGDRLFQQSTEQGRIGQFAAALQPLQQALTIYREIRDTRQEAITLIGLGSAYLGLNNLPRATDSLQQSLSLARAINDRQVEVLALQGLSLAQSASNPRKAEADQLLQQGIQQLQTSQFEAALQSFQQALTIYREIKHRLGEGYALTGLGLVHVLSLGDYTKAIEYYQQSL